MMLPSVAYTPFTGTGPSPSLEIEGFVVDTPRALEQVEEEERDRLRPRLLQDPPAKGDDGAGPEPELTSDVLGAGAVEHGDEDGAFSWR